MNSTQNSASSTRATCRIRNPNDITITIENNNSGAHIVSQLQMHEDVDVRLGVSLLKPIVVAKLINLS